MNRKASMIDVFVIMGVIFAVVIGIFFFVYFQKNLSAGIRTALPNSSITNTALVINNNIDNSSGTVLDFFIIMLMFSMPLISMILAFFNDVHPILLWASIGLSLVIVIAASWIAIMYGAFVAGTLSITTSYLPMTNFMMNNFIIYSLYCIVVILAGTFIKTRNPQGY